MPSPQGSNVKRSQPAEGFPPYSSASISKPIGSSNVRFSRADAKTDASFNYDSAGAFEGPHPNTAGKTTKRSMGEGDITPISFGRSKFAGFGKR